MAHLQVQPDAVKTHCSVQLSERKSATIQLLYTNMLLGITVHRGSQGIIYTTNDVDAMEGYGTVQPFSKSEHFHFTFISLPETNHAISRA